MNSWPEALFVFLLTMTVILCVFFISDCEKHCIDRSDCIGNKSIITK